MRSIPYVLPTLLCALLLAPARPVAAAEFATAVLCEADTA